MSVIRTSIYRNWNVLICLGLFIYCFGLTGSSIATDYKPVTIRENPAVMKQIEALLVQLEGRQDYALFYQGFEPLVSKSTSTELLDYLYYTAATTKSDHIKMGCLSCLYASEYLRGNNPQIPGAAITYQRNKLSRSLFTIFPQISFYFRGRVLTQMFMSYRPKLRPEERTFLDQQTMSFMTTEFNTISTQLRTASDTDKKEWTDYLSSLLYVMSQVKPEEVIPVTQSLKKDPYIYALASRRILSIQAANPNQISPEVMISTYQYGNREEQLGIMDGWVRIYSSLIREAKNRFQPFILEEFRKPDAHPMVIELVSNMLRLDKDMSVLSDITTQFAAGSQKHKEILARNLSMLDNPELIAIVKPFFMAGDAPSQVASSLKYLEQNEQRIKNSAQGSIYTSSGAILSGKAREIYDLYEAGLLNKVNYDKARKLGQEVLQQKDIPQDLFDEAIHAVAWGDYYLGDTTKAEMEFKQIIQDYPRCKYRPNALIKLGNIYQQTNRNKEAYPLYVQFKKDYPNHPEVFQADYQINRLQTFNTEDVKGSVSAEELIKIRNPEERQRAITNYVSKCLTDKKEAMDFLVHIYRKDPLAPDAAEYKKMIESYAQSIPGQKVTLDLSDAELLVKVKSIFTHLDSDSYFWEPQRIARALVLNQSNNVMNYLLDTLDTSTQYLECLVITSSLGSIEKPGIPVEQQKRILKNMHQVVTHLTATMANNESYSEKQLIIQTVNRILAHWEIDSTTQSRFTQAVYREIKMLPVKYKSREGGFCGNDTNLPMNFIPPMMRYLKQHDPGNYAKYVKEFHDTTAIYNFLPGFFDRELNNKNGQDNPGLSYF